ncbi:hypothetical protein MCELHM10_01064 [Paracoccaceae bacterium]|jgi:hypothetical protein
MVADRLHVRVTAVPDDPRVCSDGQTERMVIDLSVDAFSRPRLTREAFGYEVVASGVDRKPRVSLIRVQADLSTLDYEMVSDGKGGSWQLSHQGLIRLPPELTQGAIIHWASDGEMTYQITDVVNLLED